jgi:hypothetical protein
MSCRSQLCVFDPSLESHDSLWRKVFPGGEMVNDENVLLSLQSRSRMCILLLKVSPAEACVVLEDVYRGSS